MRARSFLLTALAVGATIPGCAFETAEPSTDDEASSPDVGSNEQALASIMGGVEAGIDAPWRMEPIGFDIDELADTFPPIPIVVSIHDASMQEHDGTFQSLGQFCDVTILEHWNDGQVHYDPFSHEYEVWNLTRSIPANSANVREIERSDKWPYSSDQAANHRLCRRWRGETCGSDVLTVGSSAEWHATIHYTPQQDPVNGTIANNFSRYGQRDSIVLTVMARIAKPGVSCGVAPTMPAYTAKRDRLTLAGGFYIITNTLSIKRGDPLPRFDDGWVYGDLHYHSQGTDNEGESGYAYRPTLQAMRAMGLDFVFATEHASDSPQVTDIEEVYLDKRFDIPYVPEFIEDMAYDFISKYRLGITQNANAGRDMNSVRFASMYNWLNQPGTGANAEVMRVSTGGTKAPRIFLGGEVDVVPEMSTAERTTGSLLYGNGRIYRWGRACAEVPEPLPTIDEWTTFEVCESAYDLTEQASEGGRWLIKDIQGLGDQYFARQHMVYLPTSLSPNAFVSSRTTLFGGGSQRLKDILDANYANTMIGKGIGFLAHPVDASSGSGMGRLGPDIIPYSDVQLQTAFRSQAILGLELWNENTRLESASNEGGFPFNPVHEYAEWLGAAPVGPNRDLYHGAFAWDKMLQWGIRRSQTQSIPWLNTCDPRRVFMAGGSDAHGDLNYRREGRLDGLSGVVDTAIGKPRNLVYVGARTDSVLDSNGQSVPTLGQTQVTTALQSGQFSVTDGPALRIGIDWNGNRVIDAGDTPMGAVGNMPSNRVLPVIVEWKSTYEFQPVKSIDLYVGVANQSTDASLVYAPVNHGVHSTQTPSGALSPNIYRDASGGQHRKLYDNYMADPTGLLRIIPTASDYVVGGSPLWGRRTIYLPIDSFTVGRLRDQPGEQGEEVCTPNHWCNKPGYGEYCEIECTFPPPGPTTYHFDALSNPDRVFVRAMARTQTLAAQFCSPTSTYARRGQCIERLAFSNPVWARPWSFTCNIVAPPPVFTTRFSTARSFSTF